jgi:DNA-binding MarR family transcriptional regulator
VLERIVMRMAAKENRWRDYERAAAQAGVAMEPDQLWLLARIAQMEHRDTVSTLAKRLAFGDDQCKALLAKLIESDTATAQFDGSVELTNKGRDVFDKLILRREADLEHMLRDWSPDEHPVVRAKLATLVKHALLGVDFLPPATAVLRDFKAMRPFSLTHREPSPRRPL